MTYEDFLKRVQEQSGLSSQEETARAVTATLRALTDALGGGADALPQELRQLLPGQMMGAGDSDNPQLEGETRVESGGESTADSGQ